MNSLFKSADIIANTPPAKSMQPEKQAEAIKYSSESSFVSAAELSVIRNTIGDLEAGKSIWFKTDGAWSNYHLLEYILGITGPAAVYFTTWAISEDAITRFLKWAGNGMITELYAVIDAGLRNRKPAVFHQAQKAFKNLKIAHCHAKATVVISDTHHITLIGSANFTRNPRKEVGVILWDVNIANANMHWIMEEINGR